MEQTRCRGVCYCRLGHEAVLSIRAAQSIEVVAAAMGICSPVSVRVAGSGYTVYQFAGKKGPGLVAIQRLARSIVTAWEGFWYD